MEFSREQLNQQARLLAKRAQLLSVGLTASNTPQPAGDGEEEGITELRKACRLLEERVQQVKVKCRLLPELPVFDDKESPLGLLLQQRHVQAELAVWQKQAAAVLSTDSAVVEAATRHQLEESRAQLVEVLGVVRGRKVAASKQLEREQKLLRESREIEVALRDKISLLEKENANSICDENASNVLLALQEETESLKDILQAFVQEHILQQSELREKGRRRTKRGDKQQSTLDNIVTTTTTQPNSEKHAPDLAQVILRLVGRSLDCPHDPYLSVEGVWPPHCQLLLRSGAVQRHPDNPTLIRITSFHH